MKEQTEAPDRSHALVSAKTKRRYLKPTFRFERIFETMALSCGKTNTVQAQCAMNRKNS